LARRELRLLLRRVLYASTMAWVALLVAVAAFTFVLVWSYDSF
jgi:hypothetical protein